MTQNKEENHLIEERRKKLSDLRASKNAFPNDFRRKNLAKFFLRKSLGNAFLDALKSDNFFLRSSIR